MSIVCWLSIIAIAPLSLGRILIGAPKHLIQSYLQMHAVLHKHIIWRRQAYFWILLIICVFMGVL
jgi:hypothetical protein